MRNSESEAVQCAKPRSQNGQLVVRWKPSRGVAMEIRIMAALAATLIGLACGGSGGSSSGSRNFGAKLSASSLTFASQGVSTTSGSQSVSVTNTGILDLSFSAITITGANAAAFAIGTNTCKGADILPNTSCTIAVTFTPSSTGSLTATLDITEMPPTVRKP